MRQVGLHMEWSHIWSLLNWNEKDNNTWMDDSTQDVTWWLEMVKVARKGFKVLSKGEGQATAWWPKNLAKVKKEVLAFSWGTNQATMVILMWRIKSILDKSFWSDLMHWELFIFDEWNQVTCSRWLCSSEKIYINILAPSLDEDWNTRLWLKENYSKGLNSLYIWIWVNRDAVLLRGMHHVDR